MQTGHCFLRHDDEWFSCSLLRSHSSGRTDVKQVGQAVPVGVLGRHQKDIEKNERKLQGQDLI